MRDSVCTVAYVSLDLSNIAIDAETTESCGATGVAACCSVLSAVTLV